MNYTCVAAALLPHPPIMLPEIGGPELAAMTQTIQAVQKAAQGIVSQRPETIVIMSPHAYVFPDGAAIFPEPRLSGNLGAFGYPELSMSCYTDMDLAEEIIREAQPIVPLHCIDSAWSQQYGHPLTLDQGTFVPLYYLRKAGFDGPIVLVSPRFSQYDSMTVLGKVVTKAAQRLQRRIAVVASGDLSHRLLPQAPNGYSPQGAVFDNTVMTALQQQDMTLLRAMPQSLIDEAGMCGLPSVYFLFGALHTMNPVLSVYSYEGPFGVGYGVALYINDDKPRPAETPAQAAIPVTLARQSISYYLQHRSVMAVPSPLPEELMDKAGAFVSLRKGSRLRGCIGTFLPMQLNIASEIIHNAVSAATRDPRFAPLQADELPDISISVDILGTPEAVTSMDELDPKKYGVIVMSHAQTGLLLPDLEGIDTPQQQLAVAKEKAGIPPQVQPDIYRFTVTRYE